jgi:serine protease DegQ
VGINTAIYAESVGGSLGIGFAIPVDTARKVMHEIVQTGAVKRGWLGIEPQDITPDLARAFKLKRDSGAVVAGVIHNGLAGKAGLRVGDIVRMVNRVEVANTSALLGLIAELPIGQAATLSVLRSGKPLDVRVQVGARPRKPDSGRSGAQ